MHATDGLAGTCALHGACADPSDRRSIPIVSMVPECGEGRAGGQDKAGAVAQRSRVRLLSSLLAKLGRSGGLSGFAKLIARRPHLRAEARPSRPRPMARAGAGAEGRPWCFLVPETNLAAVHSKKPFPLTLPETLVGRTVKAGPGGLRLEEVLQGARSHSARSTKMS